MTGSISKSQVEAAKSMYTVCNFADVLSTIRNMQSSCEYEGDYENDERDYALAEKLHEWLTEGVDIFQLMVEDETSELVAAAKAAGGNIMEKAKKMTLAAHFKKAAAGHEKMAEVHADKAAAHEDMMEACKCAMGKADVGDTGSDKEVMSALHSGHKSMAKAEHAMSKVHAGLAEHCTKMAEGYEGGEDAPSDKQPADTKKAEEAEVEKAAAAKAAADLELKKAADAKSAADADALTKAIEAAVAPFKAKVEELEGKLTKANEPTPPPSGLTFIPRDVAKSMSAVTVSDSDNGL